MVSMTSVGIVQALPKFCKRRFKFDSACVVVFICTLGWVDGKAKLFQVFSSKAEGRVSCYIAMYVISVPL